MKLVIYFGRIVICKDLTLRKGYFELLLWINAREDASLGDIPHPPVCFLFKALSSPLLPAPCTKREPSCHESKFLFWVCFLREAHMVVRAPPTDILLELSSHHKSRLWASVFQPPCLNPRCMWSVHPHEWNNIWIYWLLCSLNPRTDFWRNSKGKQERHPPPTQRHSRSINSWCWCDLEPEIA